MLSLPRHPPTSTLFPYTTLFRSLPHLICIQRNRANPKCGIPKRDHPKEAVCRLQYYSSKMQQHNEETKHNEIGRAQSELQSQFQLVCRLLLEKKKKDEDQASKHA